MPTTTLGSRRWWALLIIATAQFMVIMDTSIIGVALPEIQHDLGFSQDGLQWVFNAYVIAFGGLLLLGGRLSDLFGARRVFLGGWAVLAAGSLVAGLADTTALEIVGRAAQGVGAALIAPASLTLLMVLFSHDPRELGKAMAVYGAAAPAGGTAGVFLGGVITEWLSWPWVFFINVPVAVAVLAVSGQVLPAVPARRATLDLAGAVSATAGLALAVYAIVQAPTVGWGEMQTVAALVGALALLGVFVAVQRVRREPLMPLGIWRAPNLAAANLSMALLGAAWIPTWFVLNLVLQQVLGYGAFEGGAALLPMTLLIMVLMIGLTGRLMARFALRTLIASGLLVLGAGLAGLSLVRPDGTFAVDVLPASLVAATGMALAFIPAMMAALSGARPEQGGLASGIVNTSYQVGSALGLAVMTAIATSQGADKLGDPAALTDGYSAAFTGAAIVAVAGGLLTLGTMRSPSAAAAGVEEAGSAAGVAANERQAA